MWQKANDCQHHRHYHYRRAEPTTTSAGDGDDDDDGDDAVEQRTLVYGVPFRLLTV
jgi:hypothetical protein